MLAISRRLKLCTRYVNVRVRVFVWSKAQQ